MFSVGVDSGYSVLWNDRGVLIEGYVYESGERGKSVTVTLRMQFRIKCV